MAPLHLDIVSTGGTALQSRVRFGWVRFRDFTDIGTAGTKSTADSYSLAPYASYRPRRSIFVDGVAGVGALNYDSRRWVSDAGEFAQGSRDGHQWFASLSGGCRCRRPSSTASVKAVPATTR